MLSLTESLDLMPPMNPVEYAEQVLGANSVYEDALKAHADMDMLVTDLDALKDRRRELDSQVDDREVELLIETRNTHADWSKTAVNDAMKEYKNQDPRLRELRAILLGINSQIAGLEADTKVQEFLVNVKVARMQELGGYFAFLAACKNAQQTANNQSTSQQPVNQENA